MHNDAELTPAKVPQSQLGSRVSANSFCPDLMDSFVKWMAFPRSGLGGPGIDPDLDLASGFCQELYEHVDTEAINLSSNQVTNTRLLDTK